MKRLAEMAGLAVERLETFERPSRFDSIQQFVDVQIACAGRTDGNGQLAMGLVDLEDVELLPAIEAFSEKAHEELGPHVAENALAAPFATDEISARA